jgi:uncharacterized phiE125 gp8 family phage protein
MRVTLVTAPTVEPITIAEARRQCRVTMTNEDALLNSLIVAARQRAEAITGRQLTDAVWRADCDQPPDDLCLELPKPPLQTVDAITYLDAAGAEQTWAASNYQVDAPAGPFAMPGRVGPVPSATWPLAGSGYFNSFRVQFTAGYGTNATDVPQAIRLAMLLMIGGWYVNREDMSDASMSPIPTGAIALLTPYKVHR